MDGRSGNNLLQTAVLDGDYDTALKASAFLDDFVKWTKVEETTHMGSASSETFAAEILLKRPTDITNLYDKMFEIELSLNRLHHSARKDDVEEVLELVLNGGVDIDVSAANNLTPLMWASKSSSSMLIESLIDLGADVNAHRADDNRISYLLIQGAMLICVTRKIKPHTALQPVRTMELS